MLTAVLIIVIVLLLLNLVILFRIFRGMDQSVDNDYSNKISIFESKIEDYGKNLREEFSTNRNEYNENFKKFREELGTNLNDNRTELSNSIKSFEEKLSGNVNVLVTSTSDRMEKIRETVDSKLDSLQKNNDGKLEKIQAAVDSKLDILQRNNNEKLEEMRQTVDEKLHSTLEKRLTDSFKLVSERLEAVQKGLGEMQNLASGVGDLKKVLSNVKTKGVLGEYQLDGLLEQLLSPQQYEKNVRTSEKSREAVEFAIKIPDKNTEGKYIWLPIDAKFPTEDYERLQNAYESGERNSVDESLKALASKIDKFAKDINTKYINPPATTDFAVMFLPFEGLYAEVLRIPGLFEKIQNNYKVTITGPTTLSALVNSLQMGFRTLAIQQRSVEVWQVLGAVKTEFTKFNDLIANVKKKLDSARDELDKTDARTKKITSKLKKVESLPLLETTNILGIDDNDSSEDEDE